MTITPIVSLNGARTDENRLQGRERSVALHGGEAFWPKVGIGAEKMTGGVMTGKPVIMMQRRLNAIPFLWY